MQNNREPEQFREINQISRFWSSFRNDKAALISLYLFIALLILVLIGHLIAPYHADQQFVGKELMPPSWDAKGQINHFMGTDDLGRDIFSRILAGFYYTVGSSLIVCFFIAVLGGIIGVWAGLNEGKSISFLSHLFDTFLFIPALLITIIIATLMEPSLINAMFAIFLALLPHFIHRIYQVTQAELKREYVVTLRLDGANHKTLVKEVILPNVMNVATKELSMYFAFTILDISALSFIALGAASGTPEWGAMIRDSAELIYIAPWTIILPGLAITLSILIITLLSNNIIRVLTKYRNVSL
ncbi:MAG: ABC transporter permease subunit [Actinobacillus minor]|nr:ABC transporter permease subunit [Actinobacillus minor]